MTPKHARRLFHFVPIMSYNIIFKIKWNEIHSYNIIFGYIAYLGKQKVKYFTLLFPVISVLSIIYISHNEQTPFAAAFLGPICHSLFATVQLRIDTSENEHWILLLRTEVLICSAHCEHDRTHYTVIRTHRWHAHYCALHRTREVTCTVHLCTRQCTILNHICI